MQFYTCENCDNLRCETSVCPICNRRTILQGSVIYYCKKCNAPVFNDVCSQCQTHCEPIGTDLRPVFAEERLLIECLLNKPFCFANKSVWCLGANNYLIDGKKVRFSFTDFKKNDSSKIIELLKINAEKNKPFIDNDFASVHIQNFIKCNSYRNTIITDEAIQYIKEMAKQFDLSSMFISFSGGKDSTVVSHLVMRALGTESIIHIYGDTTLEYPTSKEYIDTFKKTYRTTPILIAKNTDQDFSDLCEVIGPPSRVMRWCCTIFKTGAITRKIEQTFRNKTRLLSFQGIRRGESTARSKYERDTDSPKISKQIASSPIIDWTDFDVWLYILSNNIPFNSAYRQGFSRVGCWCCPNNSGWSEYLSSIYMNEEYTKFRTMLYDFAKKVGKEDWKNYIDEGSWKARQGGNGLDHSKNAVVTFKPCALDEQSINYSLSRPISQEMYELFKPFGTLNFFIGNKRLGEVYVLSRRTMEPIIKITGKLGATELRITVVKVMPPFKTVKEILDLAKNQITKYQTCIGCSYCQSVCKFNALKVVNLKKGNVSNETICYTIDENKCIGCLECVKHFEGGCYMKKVLRTKKENR